MDEEGKLGWKRGRGSSEEWEKEWKCVDKDDERETSLMNEFYLWIEIGRE